MEGCQVLGCCVLQGLSRADPAVRAWLPSAPGARKLAPLCAGQVSLPSPGAWAPGAHGSSASRSRWPGARQPLPAPSKAHSPADGGHRRLPSSTVPMGQGSTFAELEEPLGLGAARGGLSRPEWSSVSPGPGLGPPGPLLGLVGRKQLVALEQDGGALAAGLASVPRSLGPDFQGLPLSRTEPSARPAVAAGASRKMAAKANMAASSGQRRPRRVAAPRPLSPPARLSTWSE